MFLHLPIVILATLSPITVSDTVPDFDILRECRLEGESVIDFDRCQQDEADAREQLRVSWPKFVVADKSTCVTEATVGGFVSYVELLSCLEMARDVKIGDSNPSSPQNRDTMRLRTPGVTVGVGHDPITPAQTPSADSR
jgi:hypothetical protein